MKELWSDDNSVIAQEIQFLIDNKIQLICGRRGPNNMKRLRVKGTTKSKADMLLVLHHPHEPTCKKSTCLFYFQKKKNNLRYFECEKAKKAGDFLGFMFPAEIYEIHRRNFKRVETPTNSSVSFSIENKQRIYNGNVEDISIDGAKFSVNVPTAMAKEDVVTNLTLTLHCYARFNDEVRLHIPQAKVVWLKGSDVTTHTLGVQFVLLGRDHDKLSDYIQIRSLEEADNNE